MKSKLPLTILLMSLASFAQTPAYTQSTSFACNGVTCNGLPLDQGGTWQFIKLNQAFSITSGMFYIYGNPGSGTGGVSDWVDAIPNPPNLYLNGSTGGEGLLTFSWTAVNADGSAQYTGHATTQGHKVRHCIKPPRGSASCSTQLIVDDAEIFINSVN